MIVLKIRVETTNVLGNCFCVNNNYYDCINGTFYLLGTADELIEVVGALLKEDILEELEVVGFGYTKEAFDQNK